MAGGVALRPRLLGFSPECVRMCMARHGLVEVCGCLPIEFLNLIVLRVLQLLRRRLKQRESSLLTTYWFAST